jgi:RNA polymerase sigma-70 factor, ECF subfamily
MEPHGFSSNEEDARLVARLRAGDTSAMDELVLRHYRNVFNLVYRLSGSQVLAEGVTSEVFIRVHNRLPGFPEGAHFTTWLYRIVKDAFFDERKRRAAEPGQE